MIQIGNVGFSNWKAVDAFMSDIIMQRQKITNVEWGIILSFFNSQPSVIKERFYANISRAQK